MSDSPEDLARRAAARLAAETDPALPAMVERCLRAGDDAGETNRVFDPATAFALGSLLVAIAALAWTVYRDLKKETPTPSPEVLSRRIRLKVELPAGLTENQRDRQITVVVEELVGG